MYPELSHEIIGLAMKVQNRYGTGYNEQIYQRALEEAYEHAGIQFVSQPKLPVYSLDSGKKLGWYQPDLLIDDKVIVEIKASNYTVQKFEKQTKQYLRTSKYSIAYLINFGINPLYFKRFIHSSSPN